MAAIEKVCELTGEYPGWLMYDYKRDLIQVMPHCRKAFRNAEHTLHVFKPEKKIQFKRGGGIMDLPQYCVEEGGFFWRGGVYDSVEEAIGDDPYTRLVTEYNYMLELSDEYLKGSVNGCYYNYSYNISTVKRKLKRMLRCKKLKIIFHDCCEYEFALEKEGL